MHDDVFRMLDLIAKVSRFISRFYQPGTEAVDAFTHNMDGENNWFLPPVSQISRVIAHAGACKAVETLVIPMRKLSYVWLLSCENGKHWNAFVRHCLTLPKFKNPVIKGKAKSSRFWFKEFVI